MLIPILIIILYILKLAIVLYSLYRLVILGSKPMINISKYIPYLESILITKKMKKNTK